MASLSQVGAVPTSDAYLPIARKMRGSARAEVAENTIIIKTQGRTGGPDECPKMAMLWSNESGRRDDPFARDGIHPAPRFER